MNKKLNNPFGIIQSRGLGDILIALPIAKFYYDQGRDVVWPICEPFYGSVKDVAPWVTWVPIPVDQGGKFFYERPQFEIGNAGCKDWVCLYQALTGRPELAARPYFQIQKFDEHKYTAAGVPFKYKWTLDQCITRDFKREQTLFDSVVTQPEYFVTHLTGSSYKAPIDLSNIPDNWQHIEVEKYVTENIFDWLKIIEGAQALIAVDSVVANMVDQLDLQVDKYWIPRSHIHLTPVLGSNWTILEPPSDSLAAKAIFGVPK